MTQNPSEADKPVYGGHANSDLTSRHLKSLKIASILERRTDLSQADVLDIGAGAGQTANFLKPRVRSVTATDRETDAFLPTDIPILETPGTDLPFDASSFDIVVFNHVIEHVGERDDQRRILSEIARILRPDGLLYLAVPNRWTLVEPHYRLAFLSWLPPSLASRYVRWRGKNDWYDCRPFAHRELLKTLQSAGFETDDATEEAFRDLLKIEKPDSRLARLLAGLPSWLVRAAVPLMPTFVVICRARDQSHRRDATD